MNIYDYIARKIKELRETYAGQGISQEQLAAHIKVTPNTVSRWETATYKPKIADLERLAKFFGVPISSFLPLDQQPNTPELNALFSATADLKKEDIQALTEFALFRKTRKVLSSQGKTKK